MLKVISIFIAVFVAELGDKTQLATLLFASEGEHHPLLVFAAAAGALVLSTALAVLIGTLGEKWLGMLPLKLISGIGFIAIGVWTLVEHYRGG